VDDAIKQYADSLYVKARSESALDLGQALTKHFQEGSRTQNHLQLFSGADYQVQLRIYADHIERATAVRLESYQKAFGEISRSPTEAELTEILNDFKATWELEITQSNQSLGRSLAARSAPPVGIDLPGNLRARSAHGHDRVLNEWKLWRSKILLEKQSEHKPRVELTSDGLGEERHFAQMAIEEAQKSVPEDERHHPKVGAVVVKDGKVVSKAHRGETPKCHAEFIALESKLSDVLVAGSTVYTTLEPCTTRKHPKIPCAQRLIERRVDRVVIGMLDPNPEIRGLGIQALNDAGIETQLFPRDLQCQIEELNREFIRAQKERQVRTNIPPQKTTSEPEENPKVAEIIKHKGKTVTVFNRQKYGHGYLEGFWSDGTVVVNCTPLWVVLEEPQGKSQQSFPLDTVEVAFDFEKNRLKLTLYR
jgi:pyrimidine deaminase RibD-like protein